MSGPLRLIELRPSPNNIKVRLGLRLKGCEFETIPVALDDAERAEVLRLSGQPLTPVLLDGDLPVWDSAAILRHLDTIAPHEPIFFGRTRERIHEVERWERWARGVVYDTFTIVPGMAFRGAFDPAEVERANAEMRRHTARIEEALADRDYLLGDAPTAADLTLVPMVFSTMLTEEQAAASRIAAFLRQHFHLGEERDRTRAWVERLMAHWH
ncbi:MAG: glutathione S-transferase family protein [Planctomycetota bacterium]|nr:MAG: glutathione S-transferase family protein [Planctomycetota bacterium]